MSGPLGEDVPAGEVGEIAIRGHNLLARQVTWLAGELARVGLSTSAFVG